MFRFAKMSDRKNLTELWYDCFGDGEKYVLPFLDNFLKEDTAFVCEEAGRVVSVVYALDCMIGNRKACYFYAIATDSHFRRRGLARKEIEFLIDYKSKKGAEIFLLTASNEKNNAYYKHLGFEDSFYCQMKTFYKTDEKVEISENYTCEEIYSLRKKLFSGDGYVSFPEKHIDFALNFTQRVFVYRENGNLVGYAMVDGKKFTEVCCEKNADEFVSAILSEIEAEKADIYLPLSNYEGCKISRGMVYYTDKNSDNKSCESVFLSLNLE